MKRLFVLLCALALLVSCSHQHYAYLNAAEQRENVTAAQREEYAAFVWRVERRNQEGLPDNFRTCPTISGPAGTSSSGGAPYRAMRFLSRGRRKWFTPIAAKVPSSTSQMR